MSVGQSFELDPEAGRAFLSDLMAEALGLVYAEPQITTSGASKTEIQNILPSQMPTTGYGPEAFMELIRSAFVPHIRSYRHRLHFGHQRPAPTLASTAADVLSGVTNTTVSVFEAGPFSVALEDTVQSWLRDLFRLPDSAAVTFTNGGSESTLTALFCARERWDRLNPGNDFRDACVLIGAHAHYCVERSARVIGIRPENILRVPTDQHGRVSILELRQMVKEVRRAGQPVLAIVANAGTTATTAFDDLRTCGSIARECGAWFHVDASHGGAAVFEPALRAKLDGLAQADSFGWNPHKLMWVSPPCACLMVRERSNLHRSLAKDLVHAHYIVDQAQRPDNDMEWSENLEWTLACTRQFSAFKVFATAYIYGTGLIGNRVVAMCRLAAELAELLQKADQFELFCEPEFNIVCFRHLGGGDLDEFNRRLRARLVAGPDCYLTGVEIDGAYWLRAQFTSETTTPNDLPWLIELIDIEAQAFRHCVSESERIGS